MKRKIMPPTYFMILLVLSVIFHFLFRDSRIIFLPLGYIGLALVLFGIVINLWTDSMFKRKKTTVKPHETPSVMIKSGPFGISRHPMYLGMTSILIGACVFLGSWVTFVFPLVFVVIIETLFIPMEEKNLKKIFGKGYEDYRKTVRRWI